MRHNNPSISEDKHRILNLKSAEETSEVLDYLTPTIEIKRNVNIAKWTSAANVASNTVYTTPTDKDFYLTNACISVIKDVTSTSDNTWLQVTIEGVTAIRLLQIAGITLTPQSGVIAQTFNPPLKIDRGTNIAISSSTNVANIRHSASIQGYTVETLKGV